MLPHPQHSMPCGSPPPPCCSTLVGVTWHLPGVADGLWHHSTHGEQPLPVVPFLGQQLLELSQCHHAPLDEGAVGDGLSTEVVGDHDVLARLGCATAWSLLGLQPGVHKHKRRAEYEPAVLSTTDAGAHLRVGLPRRGAQVRSHWRWQIWLEEMQYIFCSLTGSLGTQLHTEAGEEGKGTCWKGWIGQTTAIRQVQVLARPLHIKETHLRAFYCDSQSTAGLGSHQ